MEDEMAIQEAASVGLKSMEHLVRLLSSSSSSSQQQQVEQVHEAECREVTEATVSKFKRLISVLNRTGHARFRRAPCTLSLSLSSNSDSNPTCPSDSPPSTSPDFHPQPTTTAYHAASCEA